MHQKKCSIVYVRDDFDHDKTSVLAFMNYLLNDLSKKEGINTVDIFSHGQSSQFKNQYVFNCLPILLKRYNLQRLKWEFL